MQDRRKQGCGRTFAAVFGGGSPPISNERERCQAGASVEGLAYLLGFWLRHSTCGVAKGGCRMKILQSTSPSGSPALHRLTSDGAHYDA